MRVANADETAAGSGPDPARVLAALHACERLSGVPDDVLAATSVDATLLALAPDQTAFRTGEPGTAMFVVETGRIAARLRSPDGQVVDMGVVGAGEMFGYFEMFDGGDRNCDAVAVTPSTVVVLPRRLALAMFSSGSGPLLAVIEDLLQIIRTQTRTAGEQAFLTVPMRLATLLLEEAGDDGRIVLESSQSQLAHRLGVARQTVNRALGDLASRHLVSVEPGGRAVAILDRPGLLALTQAGPAQRVS